MLRAAVLALAPAYCGAKGPPHPPASEGADAGAPSAEPVPADAGVP